MNRLTTELPILIFRLALVAVSTVTLGGVLVVAGASWHTALWWSSRAGLLAALVVCAIWLRTSLKDKKDA